MRNKHEHAHEHSQCLHQARSIYIFVDINFDHLHSVFVHAQVLPQ